MSLLRAGDRGWLVECGAHSPAAVAVAIRAQPWAERLQDVVPAAATVLVVASDAATMPQLAVALRELLARGTAAPTEAVERRTVVVPVRYDGPDLAEVAHRTGRSPAEIAELHSTAEYTVDFFGFAPGYAYIGGVPEALRVPRMDSPRPRVAAGTLAIAGPYTVVYPGNTPGGWLQIGTAELEIWNLAHDPPTMLSVGDRVVFEREAS